jgi:S-DNA-T family DNA segregation ATPase FtsK/SpoIIIE
MLRELLESPDFQETDGRLALALGKNIGGESITVDLSRMPHLLIAGTTGSGKSVGINTMILSLLYRLSPEQCKFIMIDPKMLELSVYDGIPHLLAPVVTDPKKAVVALKWTVREMEERYKRMSKLGVRDIKGYNSRILQAEAKGEVLTRTVQTGFDRATGRAASRADGACRRHPPHHRHAAPERRRHHRHHQGELPHTGELPGHLEDRQPHHPRRARRRAAARSRRHALYGWRRPNHARAWTVCRRRGG